MRFAGKSIIVTGAGSGIGRAAALGFAREGGSVVAAASTAPAHISFVMPKPVTQGARR